jgi:hypothetical protein
MYLNGQYVGLGLGDVSDEVAKITNFILRKWDRFDSVLFENNRVFTAALRDTVAELQGIYVSQGWSEPHLPGVVNLATKYAMGYLKKDVILPLYFSVEGHMSDMWVGPVAWVGEVLRAEGKALHFPTFYTNNAIPFKTQTAVTELARRIGSTVIHDPGMPAPVKFPAGTPWLLGGFSEGALAIYAFYNEYLAPGKPLHWRLRDLRGVISAGSAHREKGVCVPWIADPPPTDHQGLSDDRWVNTPWWWIEIARKGDLYTDNQSSGDRALFKTMCYKLIAKGQFSGGSAGFLARVIDLLNPADDLIPVALAVYDGMRFVGNMGPHGQYPMEHAVQFAKDRLAAPPILT